MRTRKIASRQIPWRREVPNRTRRAVLTGGAVGLAAVAGRTLGVVEPANAQTDTQNLNASSSASAQPTLDPTGGFLVPSPQPVTRRPAWRSASWSQIFQTGHRWSAKGSGVAKSNLNDKSIFIKGTQSVTVTTAGNGQQAALRRTGMPAFDLKGKMLRLTFRFDDVTHLSNIHFYAGTKTLANSFNFLVHAHGQTQNMVQSGEWVTLTIGWPDLFAAGGSFSISRLGVPSTTTGFTDMQFEVHDDGSGSVTYHLQAIEIIPATSATFPRGIISIVFDDSYQSAYDLARPVMDTYGHRGTLYTIAQNIDTSTYLTTAELQNLQAISGWEIAGHAYTSAAHSAGYQTLTASQVEDEMRFLRAWMLSKGFSMDSFAYPRGFFNLTTDGVPIDQICSQYFSTGRTILIDSTETFPPAMPYRLRSRSGISSAPGATAVSNITKTGGPLDRCHNDQSWLILTLHQIVTSGVTANTQLLQSDFKTLLTAISSLNIPVLPVSDVIRNFD